VTINRKIPEKDREGQALKSIILLLLLLAFTAPTIAVAQQPTQPSATSPQTSTTDASPSAKGLCWPQVGVFAQGAAIVTGASVEIRALTPQKLTDRNAALAYWVGIYFTNGAFIQAGYYVWKGSTHLFWTYLPAGTPRTAPLGAYVTALSSFHYSNGTWIMFSLTVSGTSWAAYASNLRLGLIDLKASSADENQISAVAEVAGTSRTDNILGPVEFRNLSYRDMSGSWHPAEMGKAYIGLGTGSSHVGCGSSYSIAEMQGVNNYWIAGSITHSPSLYTYFRHGDYLWPWYQLTYNPDVRCDSRQGWYLTSYAFSCQIPSIKPVSPTERESFQAWIINGQPSPGPSSRIFWIWDSNMNIGAAYVKQFYVNVTSPYGQTQGSGWYNEGGTVKISLSPTIILNEGFLGTLGVGKQFTGWTGDYSGSNSTAQLKVDSAKSISGEWSTTYGYLPELVAVMVIVLVATIVVLTLRKRVRR
jgi:hypothetical protein